MNPANGTTAVRAENLTRHYQMGESVIRAVDGVTLDIASGEFAAMLGSSGSGKSSLLNLIAGLDRPTSGTIAVDGSDLAQLSREDLARYRRHTVGIVFQAFNLIPTMSVAENVELPLRFAEVSPEDRRKLANESLQRVGLATRLRHRPTELSGGEQQRVALARALVNRPKVLLADEPTGNLDSKTGREILDLIQDLNRRNGITVIMVTHERDLADRYATRQIFLGDGRVIADERKTLAGDRA
ncbi:MAG: ABC transporter ATP-binding protein [Terriglobales bacterium]